MQISRYFTQDTDWWSLHHDLSKPKPTPFMMALASQKPNWCKMASFQMPTKAHLNGKQIVHNLKYTLRLHGSWCAWKDCIGFAFWTRQGVYNTGVVNDTCKGQACWSNLQLDTKLRFQNTCKSTLEHQAATIINYSSLWWNLMPVQSLISFNWDKVQKVISTQPQIEACIASVHATSIKSNPCKWISS